MPVPPLVTRMAAQIRSWQASGDQRFVFLSCYRMMTENILTAVHQREFLDSMWVDRFMHRFADYYYAALEAFEREPSSAPKVWQVAHNAARDPRVNVVQRLLLGISAHINYDLVFTLVDLLETEWTDSNAERRTVRYFDYCSINIIVARTIDAVQDDLIEPAMLVTGLFDEILGPLDELFAAGLFSTWRESTWRNAVSLLESPDPSDRARIIGNVEALALLTAQSICPYTFHEPDS